MLLQTTTAPSISLFEILMPIQTSCGRNKEVFEMEEYKYARATSSFVKEGKCAFEEKEICGQLVRCDLIGGPWIWNYGRHDGDW